MIHLKNKLAFGVVVAVLSLNTVAVQRAIAFDYVRPPIHCTFDTCNVDIAANQTLSLSCEGRAMYAGPYKINTDFRTIQIECPDSNGPRITTQSLPTSNTPTKATLFISNRQIDGTCQADPSPTS